MVNARLAKFRALVEANPDPRFCACGCGERIILILRHVYAGIPRYAFRHKNLTPSVDRFWAKVDKDAPGGCWLWTGLARVVGYGSLYDGASKRSIYTHRFSWKLHNGPIPDGLFVCHKCDVKLCVNPAHLFLGTAAGNSADMVGKGRQAKGEQRSSKLTEQNVRAIRQLAASGIRPSKIAPEFGVAARTIRDIIQRKTWGHVPAD